MGSHTIAWDPIQVPRCTFVEAHIVMSQTYRLTYTLTDRQGRGYVARVCYVTTGDPQLGYLLSSLQGVTVQQVDLVGEQAGQTANQQCDRKVG